MESSGHQRNGWFTSWKRYSGRCATRSNLSTLRERDLKTYLPVYDGYVDVTCTRSRNSNTYTIHIESILSIPRKPNFP